MQPLLTNDRAKREWQYIVERVGESRALEAISQLPGNRRPYPINVARILRIKLPPDLEKDPPAPPPPEIKMRLAELRAQLAKRI